MTWQEALDNYFLAHETMNETNRAWLRDHVVMDAPLIREMSAEQLDATFSKNGKTNHTRLLRTYVWQTMGLVLCGDADPVNGNVRAYWYRFSDPLYNHFGLYSRLEDDPEFQNYLHHLDAKNNKDAPDRLTSVRKSYVQDLTEDTIKEFVEQQIFRYQGVFQFENANEGWSLLGEGRASLIFFVEKQSLYNKICKEIYNELGISVMASQGYPSLVNTEYFGDELRKKKIKNVGLGGLVDYDSDGWCIADTYRRQFEIMGFGIKDFTILTSLDLFTEATIAADSYPLRNDKESEAWFALTGGIHGKRMGIHANSASKARVKKAVKAWYHQQIEREAK